MDQSGPNRRIISAEAAVALVVALVNLALDQADIHIMLISWISVLACIILCVDVLRRTAWVKHPEHGKTRLMAGAGVILVAFLAFGIFLSLHKKADAKNMVETGPTRVMLTPDTPLAAEKRASSGSLPPRAKKIKTPTKTSASVAPPEAPINVGKDSVAMGQIPAGSKIGANANAGIGPVTVQPGGVASFGQQGGVTAGQVNVYGTDSGPLQVIARQDGNTITITTNRQIDSISLALFFDAEITGWSTSVQCSQRCIEGGRRKDSSGSADLKTIWDGWGQAFPTFTPDDPVQIYFSSSVPAKLIRLEWSPRPPF